jgi:hypothetical protein
MIVAGSYSFKDGEAIVRRDYPRLLTEIEEVIAAVDASTLRTKTSEEKTMPGRTLYDPKALNKAFKAEFKRKKNWRTVRIPAEYSREYYRPGYRPPDLRKGAFREMDFVKETLGVEVQFGKYAFMVYNVAAKMTIFNKLGFIRAGIEIVPVKEFADEMSTGVSYFEQFVWDLEKRGVADIDIPVLILGIHEPRHVPARRRQR